MSAPSFPPPRNTDPAAFGRVAVLMGGTSSEREVSLNSGRNVLEALQARGVQAHAVDGLPALLEQIRAGAIDRVFNILHGGDGENGVLQGLLSALKVPFTGPGVLGSALTLDKIRTKQVWIASGLPTPAFPRARWPSRVASVSARAAIPGGQRRVSHGAAVFPARASPSRRTASIARVSPVGRPAAAASSSTNASLA